MQYFLGIDGGGTKTAALLLDSSNKTVGVGKGGPCNIAVVAPETAFEAVKQAVNEAINCASIATPNILSVVAAVAGYTARSQREALISNLEAMFPDASVEVIPDFQGAWWGATDGKPGVIVSAGTGAVAYGRDENGIDSRADGWGFLFGDSGSGFDIGRRGADLALKQLQSGERLSPLSMRLLAEIHAISLDDLIDWAYRDFSPAKIASLAPVIGQFADEGDREAIAIVDLAADQLAWTTGEAAGKLANWETLPIYLLGGLWNSSTRLQRSFEASYTRILAQNPSATNASPLFAEPINCSEYGAALMALQEYQRVPAP
ncbi:MAG: BadF/BadG/BcrA/BcrD ATPase family protein [Chthonomonadales bacterium]